MKLIYNRFTNFTTKIIGLDTSYLAKNSFLGFIQQVVGVVCGLTIIYVFGHFGSKLLFGQYNYILSIFGLLGLVALPGLDSALIRSVAKGHDHAFIDGIMSKIRYSLLSVPIFVGFIIYHIYLKSEYEIALSLTLIALFFPLLTSLSLFNEFLTAKKKFVPLTILALVSSILTAILLCYAIYFTHNLIVITLMYIISTLAPSFAGLWYALKMKRNKIKDKNLIKYGKFLSSLNFITWATGYAGQILLGSLLGLEKLAIYSAANRFPVSIQKNIFVFYKPITSKLAYQSTNDHKRTIEKHALKLLLIGAILSVLLYFLSPVLITFFFTTSYKEAINYSRLLSLSIFPLPLSWVFSDILLYQQKKREQVILSIYPQIAKLILYIIFIPIWGINGLVFAFVAERYISLCLSYYLVRK